MNYVDVILCAIIGFFVIKSALRGAIRELFSLLALIFAYILSCRYYPLIVALLQTSIGNRWAQIIIAFVAIFIPVYLCIKIIGWLIAKFIKAIHLSPLDRIAGVLIGAAKGYLIVCFIIIMLLLALPEENRLIAGSFVSLSSLPVVEKIAELFPAPFRKVIEERIRSLKKQPQPKALPRRTRA